MYNFSFICSQSRVNKQGFAPVSLLITIDGKRTEIGLPHKFIPAEFKREMQSRRNTALKDYLASVRCKITETVTLLNEKNTPITATSFKYHFLHGFHSSYTVGMCCDDYLHIVQGKADLSEIAQKTSRKYMLSVAKFKDYIGADTELSAIQNKDIAEFRLYMKQQQYHDSTICGYLTKLKTIFDYARDNGRMEINVFHGIRLTKHLAEVQYLTAEELGRIANHQFEGRLAKVRDLFLFAANTGLSYADMADLRGEDIAEYEGVHYVTKPRKKTGVTYTAIINDDALSILERCNYTLPIITNQRYNGYLKEIADICGITKPLHSHIARHTAATQLLNKGYAIEMVAKMLGHSSIKMTQHYAKIMDKSIFKMASKLK